MSPTTVPAAVWSVRLQAQSVVAILSLPECLGQFYFSFQLSSYAEAKGASNVNGAMMAPLSVFVEENQ